MSKTLLETEKVQNRSEVAAYLQQIVDKLEGGKPLTLHSGDSEVTLEIPDRVEFEVQVEEERSGDMSLELELEWDAQNGQSSALGIS